MPKSDDTPEGLRPYVFHGVEFAKAGAGAEHVAVCPFCDGRKFYVDAATTLWSCFKCATKGNATDWLRLLHSASVRSTKHLGPLVKEKGLPAEALKAWGVCRSFITGDWLVPGFGVEGGLTNLYKYAPVGKGGRSILIGTPGQHVALFGSCTLKDGRTELDVTEGPWDGIALWNASEGHRNVIAVPGCGIFQPSWTKVCEGKEVTLYFDNDHPKVNPTTGVTRQPGFDGIKRTAGILLSSPVPPSSLSYLNWGPGGYDPAKADGWDVRDHLGSGGTLEELRNLVTPVPKEWKGTVATTDTRLTPLKCTSWAELEQAWKASGLEWFTDLRGALLVMLASVASVKGRGEQLFLKIIGKASTGKTTICRGLAVAHKYVLEESAMNGFYSGYKVDKEDTKDCSLAARIDDMAVVTKEADTILRSQAFDIIMSQARELYDGEGGKSFNNDMKRVYKGKRWVWIICGTHTVRRIDKSELGGRFIDYEIEVPDGMEERMNRRASRQQARNSRVLSNCREESTLDPDYARAIRMTGGYICHMKENTERLLRGIEDTPDDILDHCEKLAQFVSYMRARPSSFQDDLESREMSPRLTKQFEKLAVYLALVLNKSELDTEVMGLVEKVARDTARGRTLEIVKALDRCGMVGLDLKGVGKVTKQSGWKEAPYLEFLTKIHATEQFDDGRPSLAKTARWRLTPAFRRLYREVMGGGTTTQRKGVPT